MGKYTEPEMFAGVEANNSGKKSPWRRRQRRLLLVFGILLTAMACLIAGVRLWWHVQCEREDACLRAAGFPATAGDMQALLRKEPPMEAIVPGFAGAIERLGGRAVETAKDQSIAEYYEHQDELRLPSEVRLALKRYLAEEEEALQAVRRAAQSPGYRISLEPIERPPGLALEGLSHAGWLLGLEARLAAEEGEAQQSAEALLTLLHLAELYDAEGNIYLRPSGVSARRIAIDAFNKALSLLAFSGGQLLELQKAFHKNGDIAAMTGLLISERISVLDSYRRPLPLINKAVNNPLWRRIPGAPEAISYAVNLGGWVQQDRLFLMRAMNGLISASQKPAPEFIGVLHEINGTWLRRGGSAPRISDGVMPDILRGSQAVAAILTKCRAAELAAAIERYRLSFGALPEHSSDLLPLFMDKIPENPFDGQPLEHHVSGEGYVIGFHYRGIAEFVEKESLPAASRMGMTLLFDSFQVEHP